MKPLCVLLHGYPNGPAVWKDQLPLLEKNFNILNLALPGSVDGIANREDLRLSHLIEDLKEKILAEGNSEVILVGHDIGSFVLSEVAQSLGGSVKAQVFLSGMDFRLFSKRLKSSKQMFKSWYVLLFQVPFLPELTIPHFKKTMSKLIYKGSVDLSSESPNGLAPVQIYRELKAGIKKGNERRKKSRIPTLFLFGENDRFILPPEKQEIETFYQNASMELVPGGHWFMRENSDLVNTKLMDFFTGQKLAGEHV